MFVFSTGIAFDCPTVSLQDAASLTVKNPPPRKTTISVLEEFSKEIICQATHQVFYEA